MRFLVTALICLIASPTLATPLDNLRDMVWAGDTAGVKAARRLGGGGRQGHTGRA